MKKKSIVVIALIAAVVLAVLCIREVTYYSKGDNGLEGKIGRLLNKTNTFDVSYIGIDSTLIDIAWLTESAKVDTLVKSGKIIQNFGYEYGPERFIIYYKGKETYMTSFWSTNDNDPHSVQIAIAKIPTGLHFTYVFDSERFEKDVNEFE